MSFLVRLIHTELSVLVLGSDMQNHITKSYKF